MPQDLCSLSLRGVSAFPLLATGSASPSRALPSPCRWQGSPSEAGSFGLCLCLGNKRRHVCQPAQLHSAPSISVCLGMAAMGSTMHVNMASVHASAHTFIISCMRVPASACMVPASCLSRSLVVSLSGPFRFILCTHCAACSKELSATHDVLRRSIELSIYTSHQLCMGKAQHGGLGETERPALMHLTFRLAADLWLAPFPCLCLRNMQGPHAWHFLVVWAGRGTSQRWAQKQTASLRHHGRWISMVWFCTSFAFLHFAVGVRSIICNTSFLPASNLRLLPEFQNLLTQGQQ